MSEPNAATSELEQLQAQIVEAKATRVAAEQRRESGKFKQQLLDELAAERSAAKTAEVLYGLEKEHGQEGKEIKSVIAPDGTLVVMKRPNHLIYKRFADQLAKDQAGPKEHEAFVRACLVHPDKETFTALVESLPHMVTRCANAACFLAGVRKGEDDLK